MYAKTLNHTEVYIKHKFSPVTTADSTTDVEKVDPPRHSYCTLH